MPALRSAWSLWRRALRAHGAAWRMERARQSNTAGTLHRVHAHVRLDARPAERSAPPVRAGNARALPTVGCKGTSNCRWVTLGRAQPAHRTRYMETELYTPQPSTRSAPSASTMGSPVRGCGRPTMRSSAPLKTSGWPCANRRALPPLVTAVGVPARWSERRCWACVPLTHRRAASPQACPPMKGCLQTKAEWRCFFTARATRLALLLPTVLSQRSLPASQQRTCTGEVAQLT